MICTIIDVLVVPQHSAVIGIWDLRVSSPRKDTRYNTPCLEGVLQVLDMPYHTVHVS